MGVGLSSGTDRPGRHLPRRDAPIGSLTGGLSERLRLRPTRGGTIRGRDRRVDGLTFAATIERAAAGLSRRGMCLGDVVGVLAPVSPERFLATYTVMAVGGRALPLCPSTSTADQAAALGETDARLILADAGYTDAAQELAERSRVRQIISFGDSRGATPFEELLLPSPDGSGYNPSRGLFDNGVLGYESTPDGLLTTLYPHNDLLARFTDLRGHLGLGPEDVVAVEDGADEPTGTALVASALWTGACVVAGSDCPPPEGRCVTVRCGRGAPVRVALPEGGSEAF